MEWETVSLETETEQEQELYVRMHQNKHIKVERRLYAG